MTAISRIIMVFVVSFCALTFPCSAASKPSQIQLNVAMDKPVLLSAEKPQTAYIRIGLKGVAIESETERPPVNIAIVIDRSGSMSGEKLDKAKEAAIMAIRRLKADDIISVVTYDDAVQVLIPATKVSDKEAIFEGIRQVRPGGSTALFAGVSKGAEEIRKFLSEQRVNRLVLISDGLANVGPQTPSELGDLGASLVKERISVTTIGLGLGYNEDLLSKLAYKSDGAHFFAEEASDLANIFDRDFGRALSVVAQEVRTEIHCESGVRPVRVLGRSAEINGQNVVVYINQIYGDGEKRIVLEVEISPAADGAKRKIAEVDVNYGNMKTHATDKLSCTQEATFTTSPETVEKQTNAAVMVDVVRLVAVERNEMAMKLRDKGQIQEAKDLLTSNASYLYSNSTRYKSEDLKAYGAQNGIDAESTSDEKAYKKNRKQMQETQTKWSLY